MASLMKFEDEPRNVVFKALLRDHGMRFSEFAELAYFNPWYIRGIVLGREICSNAVMMAAAKLFGEDFDALMRGEYLQKNKKTQAELWKELSYILKQSRIRKGLSMAAAGEIVDVAYTVIRRIEIGKPYKTDVRGLFDALSDLYGLDKRIWYDDDLRAKVMREVA